MMPLLSPEAMELGFFSSEDVAACLHMAHCPNTSENATKKTRIKTNLIFKFFIIFRYLQLTVIRGGVGNFHHFQFG